MITQKLKPATPRCPYCKRGISKLHIKKFCSPACKEKYHQRLKRIAAIIYIRQVSPVPKRSIMEKLFGWLL